MMLFLVLAPFGTFALLMVLASPMIALLASAGVAVVTIGYDIAHGKSIKMWRPAPPYCLPRSAPMRCCSIAE